MAKKKTEQTKEKEKKEAIFIAQYLIDFNATQAAIKAGYSEKSAYSTGWRMLRNDQISKAIREGQKKIVDTLYLTREKLARRLAIIAFSNMADFKDNWDDFKNWEEIPHELRAAIQSIDITQLELGTTKKIKLHDPIKAMDSLIKLLGLNKEPELGNGEENPIVEALRLLAGKGKE